MNEMSEDKFVETHIPILRAVKENKKMHKSSLFLKLKAIVKQLKRYVGQGDQ